MIRANRLLGRVLLMGFARGPGTAGVEFAAGRTVDQAGDLTSEIHALSSSIGIRFGSGRQKGAGVWVQRVVLKLRDSSLMLNTLRFSQPF